ncbi:MAG: ABC transporter ATP-binding protein [Filifactoraceae bacterium]
MGIININNLNKTFYVSENKSFKDYFRFGKSKKKVESIKNLNLNIEKGETIGLIGLNGAGKSTLIKMMTGILAPTSGSISVLGNNPFDDRMTNNFKISTVFGQRCRLRWDISPMESYKLIKDMYDVENKEFEDKIEYFSSVLGLEKFINNPVRTLSLGQKMRAELGSAFLYNPEIIFLDEPTIGLDIITKDSIYNFLKSIKGSTTIILTTHDFDDIENLCDRVIVLNEGEVIHDSKTDDISSIYNTKILEVILRKEIDISEINMNLKKYNYTFEGRTLKIDLSLAPNTSELIKEIYSYHEDIIEYVQVKKINFKDTLKHFLKEQSEFMGDSK